MKHDQSDLAGCVVTFGFSRGMRGAAFVVVSSTMRRARELTILLVPPAICRAIVRNWLTALSEGPSMIHVLPLSGFRA